VDPQAQRCSGQSDHAAAGDATACWRRMCQIALARLGTQAEDRAGDAVHEEALSLRT